MEASRWNLCKCKMFTIIVGLRKPLTVSSLVKVIDDDQPVNSFRLSDVNGLFQPWQKKLINTFECFQFSVTLSFILNFSEVLKIKAMYLNFKHSFIEALVTGSWFIGDNISFNFGLWQLWIYLEGLFSMSVNPANVMDSAMPLKKVELILILNWKKNSKAMCGKQTS